jgi:polysaccharide chain length determinant protein (PEP-CTERM system associated)
VTERLASLFIEENLRDRENVADDTNRFLESQLDDAKRRLVDQEKRLEEYRRKYSGQLPTQVQANLQAIQNAETRRNAAAAAMDRARERRTQLQQQIADLAQTIAAAPVATAAAPTTPDGVTGGTTAQQLEAAKATLAVLRVRNTPDHPDVRIMERRIRELEDKLAKETEGATANPTSAALAPAEVARQRRLKEINSEIASLDQQLADYAEEDRRLSGQVRDLQAKVDAVPTRESELVALTRDYATLQNSYQSLLAKREESKIAANMERQNIGGRFNILDPARVPERPFSPDRRTLTAIGAGIGFALGLLLVGLIEYRDSSLRNEDDATRMLALPVLAVVPLVRTVEERRRRFRVRAVATVVAIVGFSAIAAWLRLRF